MADPWDSVPVVRERSDPTLDSVIDVTNLSQQERLNLRPGQRVSINGVETRLSGSPVQDNSGVPVAEGLNVSVAPWDSVPVVPEPTESQLAAQADAARRIPDTDAVARENTLMNGLLLSGADEIGGRLAQGGQMVTNLGRQLRGLPVEVNSADINDAYVDRFRDSVGGFAQSNPIQSGALTLAGGALTGGATLGAGVAGAAATGAAYGGGSGFLGSEGGFADRLPGAAIGGVAGGALGGAIQGVGQVAAPYAQRLGGILVGPGARARAATRAGGPSVGAASRLADVIGPDQFAERARLQSIGIQPSVLDTLTNQGERLIRNAAGTAGDGADQAIRNARTRTIDLKPDVMSETRSLSPDPRSANQVREGLEDTRSTLAERDYAPAYATPVPVTEELLSAIGDEPGRAALRRARQAAVARRNTQQVDEIDRLLGDAPFPSNNSGPSLTSAIRHNGRIYRGETHLDALASMPPELRREAAGDANNRVFVTDRGRVLNRQRAQDYANEFNLFSDDAPSWARSAPEITSEVLRAPQPDRSVSAGTLDRVRIAMSNRAESLGRNATGARDVAGGLRSRAGDIDAALSDVTALAPARSTYRDLSGAIEQIDAAPAIFSTDPQDFARTVQAMTPTQREAAIIGVRQEILDTLGGQRAAGTGSIQNLSESNYARQNLETLLGPEEARAYIANIEARVQQAQRANRISPNTNSQTFGRTLDDETMSAADRLGIVVDGGQALTGNLVAIGRTIDRIRTRATLSPEERSAIVQLGLGSADDLERIVQVAEQARSAGRPPPREVRAYLVRTRNVLGAQSPVTRQLEQILLPSRALAEEDQQ